MDIQTENEMLWALKKLTVEEEGFCQPGGEYLYESLTNAYLTQKLSDTDKSDEYEAWLLALETTDGFDEVLYDVTQKVEQILYLMQCRDAYYEVPA
ncbi:hypothetical protein ARAF_2324 [Arsenophonus endosymbiont of Aleurodicus floccissimus]|uniref:hypothetical protein n=1 Tax=Arsenophonus endosymbiont of Aleurodicus floccissimus TaxID=2152761 RepID=UPI000E6AF1E5|nr:hypothetical protein [Arsenophonus endosymbiont of Aleurodicus floccissimus]SPP32283.1 hypothetical protein ARAF_2324 [Arsenophonus endosymbiont of Aleurodicus floccissimus]